MTEEDEDLARCKTFEDYCGFIRDYENQVCYEEAFALITTAEEAFELSWASCLSGIDSCTIRAMSRCFDLAKADASDDRENSLYHIVIRSVSRFQFFYEIVFSDATLVKKLAKIHGLELA